MARIAMGQEENYGSQGGGSFFTLKDHKDIAEVRFMYNTADDLEGFAVHKVEVNGKDRYVNCLRDYDEPLENCPFCEARMKLFVKLFIQVYNVDADEVQIWERGKQFFQKMGSLFSRYTPLVNTPFEIERNGKKGDTNTTYEMFPLKSDDTELEDLPEKLEILGGLVLNKSYDDMIYYLDNGKFEEEEQQAPEPPRRNPSKDRRGGARQETAAPVRRRTPADVKPSNSRRRAGGTTEETEPEETPKPPVRGRGAKQGKDVF